MNDDLVPLAYATPESVHAAWAQTRRIFAWFALGYALVIVVNGVIELVSSWQFVQSRWQYLIFRCATVLLCIPLAIGAGMTLRGLPLGPYVIRVATLTLFIASIGLSIASQLSLRSVGGTSLHPLGDLTMRFMLNAMYPTFSVPTLLFCLSFPLRRVP